MAQGLIAWAALIVATVVACTRIIAAHAAADTCPDCGAYRAPEPWRSPSAPCEACIQKITGGAR